MKTAIFYQLIFQQKLETLINCAISKKWSCSINFLLISFAKLIGGLLAIQNVPKVWVYWILKQHLHRLSFLHFNFCSNIFRNQIQNDLGFFWWPFTDYSVENDEIFWHSKDFTWNWFSELWVFFWVHFRFWSFIYGPNDVFKSLKLISRKFWMGEKFCKFPHCAFSVDEMSLLGFFVDTESQNWVDQIPKNSYMFWDLIQACFTVRLALWSSFSKISIFDEQNKNYFLFLKFRLGALHEIFYLREFDICKWN